MSMHFLKQFSARASACALVLASAAGSAAASAICSAAPAWQDADTVTVTFPTDNVTVRLHRFDDALRVKITIGRDEREMIQMDNGLTAVRAANDLGPRQFTGVDQLAGTAMHYIQQGFATPCAASAAHHFSLDVQDGPRSDASTVHLEGDLEEAGQALGYGLLVTEREGRSDTTLLQSTGTLDFADLGAIPDNTPIAGWRVYRDGALLAVGRRDVLLVEDLKRLAGTP